MATLDVLATGGGLRGAIASEWTKLWSLRSTPWLLSGGIALMAGVSAAVGVTMRNNFRADAVQVLYPVGDLAVWAAIVVAQFAFTAVAMVMITSEYSTGTIHATLQWVPARSRMLLSKTIVVGALVFVVGLPAAAAGVFAGGPTLAEFGEYEAGRVWFQILTMAVYFGIGAMITIAIGAMLRSAVGTLTTAFLGLLVIPLIMQISGFPFLIKIAPYMLGNAAMNFMNLNDTHYPPVVGLLVVVGWAIGLLLVALRILKTRDA
ncbi:hypothetical protein [Salinispora sp. H7-4]|uniref:hypothetical protein n=1 Tax=Salinispora sp. H7-4 TaxID=2748321 RepID=UPI0015D3D0E0|nr:hypothetical protein [Salinispora sp. H7-4]NYT96199.1 hypothetical protein [Salinispora sp. H7-4]